MTTSGVGVGVGIGVGVGVGVGVGLGVGVGVGVGVELGTGVGVGVGVGVPPADAVTEKSSIAKPWSAPESSGSCQRNQISCPLLTVTLRVADMGIRLAGALPSSVAAVAPVIGPVKVSGAKVVHPVVGALAPVITPALAT